MPELRWVFGDSFKSFLHLDVLSAREWLQGKILSHQWWTNDHDKLKQATQAFGSKTMKIGDLKWGMGIVTNSKEIKAQRNRKTFAKNYKWDLQRLFEDDHWRKIGSSATEMLSKMTVERWCDGGESLSQFLFLKCSGCKVNSTCRFRVLIYRKTQTSPFFA